MAKMMLDKANVKYKNIDALSNKKETTAMGIQKAPTLLVPNKAGGYDRYDNASLIKKYIEDNK